VPPKFTDHPANEDSDLPNKSTDDKEINPAEDMTDFEVDKPEPIRPTRGLAKEPTYHAQHLLGLNHSLPEKMEQPTLSQASLTSQDLPPNLQSAAPRQPNLPVLLQGALPAKGLPNPDADISCLSEETFHKLLKAGELTQSKPSSKEANGLALQEICSIHLQVCIGDRVMMHQLKVIHGLSDEIILRMDFIYQHGLCYDPVTRTLAQGDAPTPDLALHDGDDIPAPSGKAPLGEPLWEHPALGLLQFIHQTQTLKETAKIKPGQLGPASAPSQDH